MSGIEISHVQSRKDLMRFIKLPWKIYDGDPNWVPPLLMDMKKILNRRKNPFFEHSDATLFLATRDDQTVGRIAAILNKNHNRFHDETTGFFGFYESIDDNSVSAALLGTAEEWLKGRGMAAMRGPMNFSTNDTCGMLCEGFNAPPVIMMTYNPRYYLSQMEAAGLAKIKELYAYTFRADMQIPERFVQFAQKAIQNESLRFRNLDMKKFDKEVDTILSIYNDAWQLNWGFVPMTESEFKHLAADLKAGVDPDIVFVAEVDDEAAGFSLALPDFNEILKDINGRLFPFGIFKLLLNRNKIKGVRVITLGVKQKYQKKRALAPAFYYETYRRGKAKGYKVAEFSWILDDNVLMNRAAEGLGAELYKKYAIYEKSL